MINLFKYFKKKPHYKVIEADGQFAIVTRNNEFMSFNEGRQVCFWNKDSRFFLDCWTDDRKRCESIVAKLNAEFDND